MPATTDQLFIDHAGMAVPDLDATIEWYERVFEFKVTQRFGTSEFKAAFMEREGGRLEIFQPTPPPAATPVKPLTSADLTSVMTKFGYTHVAFGVPDVDAAFQQAVSRGATAVNPPSTQPGGTRFGHISDLNQNVIELIHNAPSPQPK